MIQITLTGLGITLLAISVVLPALLAVLANNRDRRPVPWALLGVVPLVNIFCLILLLWTPLPSEQDDDDDYDDWGASDGNDDPNPPPL